MKIRGRMVIWNLAVGIIPIVLSLVVFILVITGQADEAIRKNLATVQGDIKDAIDRNMHTYRDYAYFFANTVIRPEREFMSNITDYSMKI